MYNFPLFSIFIIFSLCAEIQSSYPFKRPMIDYICTFRMLNMLVKSLSADKLKINAFATLPLKLQMLVMGVVVKYLPQLGSFCDSCRLEPVRCSFDAFNGMSSVEVVSHMVPVHHLIASRPSALFNAYRSF